MKHYDRASKKWITEEERDLKLKKRDACKGGRPHDYVEVLPYGVEANDKYQGLTQPYYDAEEAIKAFTEKKYAELAAIGIIVRPHGWWPRNYRRYMCSVCHKQTTK